MESVCKNRIRWSTTLSDTILPVQFHFDHFLKINRGPRGLLISSFHSQPKAYFASLTVRLRLAVKRSAIEQLLNQQPANNEGEIDAEDRSHDEP